MSSLKPQSPSEWVWLLALFCFLAGMLASKFLLSVSTFLPVLAALYWATWADVKAVWRNNRGAVFGLGLVVWVGLTAFYSEDLVEWWTRWRVLLPLGFLPLALGLLPPPRQRFVWFLLSIFVLVYALAALAVLLNYVWDFEAITASLQHSKSLPCPQEDHIRFSLMVAWACLTALFLAQRPLPPLAPRFYWFLALFCFIFLHILSVRSGLLALYLALGFWILAQVWQKRGAIYAFGIGLALLLSPFAAYFVLPSFRAKVQLTLYNLELYGQGRVEEYSDTQRFLSYKIAWELSRQSPYFGLGMGDLWPEQRAVYERDYPGQRPIFPHNQFLSFLLALGYFGLAYFVLGLFWVWWQHRQASYVTAFFILVLSSFLTENTLFISMGVHLYAYFMVLSPLAEFSKSSSQHTL